jgi:undecaprenyl diphosphate synthase
MEKNIPKHVAIIMDGNGRWAEARGLPRSAGHLAGYENAKNLIPYIFKKGIEVVTVYAFSTENWLRELEEVNFLFDIFRKAVEELPDFSGENIRIRFIGNRVELASRGFGDLAASMERVEKETAQNTRGIFVIAINYGGRNEILSAVKEIVRLNVHPAYISERAVSMQLYTRGLPDPDLIIRTAGERRISGFQLWQSEYAEFYFSGKLWPDFGEKDFMRAIRSYSLRNRKRGGY